MTSCAPQPIGSGGRPGRRCSRAQSGPIAGCGTPASQSGRSGRGVRTPRLVFPAKLGGGAWRFLCTRVRKVRERGGETGGAGGGGRRGKGSVQASALEGAAGWAGSLLGGPGSPRPAFGAEPPGMRAEAARRRPAPAVCPRARRSHVGLRRPRHLLQRQLRGGHRGRRGAGPQIAAAEALQGVPAAVPSGYRPHRLHLQIQVRDGAGGEEGSARTPPSGEQMDPV